MSAQKKPTPAELRREAAILTLLLRRYRSDWRFLNQADPGQLVYFVDAHDLDSYIAPDKPETLRGFLFQAELVDDAEVRLADHRLKNDQMLHRLLFDGDKHVGLLPSHAQELEDQITYYSGFYDAQSLSVLMEARKQFEFLRRSSVALSLLSPQTLGNEPSAELRLGVAKLLERYAPAIMTLLRDAPETPRARIERLVDESDLAGLREYGWEKLGIPREEAQMLRAIRPSEEHVMRWWRFIESRQERQHRTSSSNRIDADAIACMQLLTELLKKLGRSHVRVVLVTRVMSLLYSTSNANDLEAAGLGPATFLRHPRMALLPGVDARLAGESMDTLSVALTTFRRQLKPEISEAAAGRIDEARSIFIKALHDFERVSFGLDLRLEVDKSHAAAEGELTHEHVAKLLEWFSHDQAFDRLLRERAADSVENFGYRTYSLARSEQPEAIDALFERRDNPPRTLIRALAAGAPGPVQFYTADLGGLGDRRQRNCDDLEKELGDLRAHPAERYLAWALLHACRQRWDLARIYARSAADLTRLVPTTSSNMTRESDLLLAQVRRLSGPDPNPRKRVREVTGRLKILDDDPRFFLERSAHILEWLLTEPCEAEEAARSIEDGLQLLEKAHRLSGAANDELTAARSLSMLLVYALAVLRRGLPWPRQEKCAVYANARHRDLTVVMQRLHTSLSYDEIPRRTFAMEIVGYLLGNDSIDPTAWLPGGAPTLEKQPVPDDAVPRSLRYFARELHLQLKDSRDLVGRLIAAELGILVGHQNEYLHWELIYAPIWSSSHGEAKAAERILDPDARAAAQLAFRILASVTGPTQLGVDPAHRRAFRRSAELFQEALDSLQSQSDEASRESGFFLRAEACYARLLLALVAADPQQRVRQLRELLGEYGRLQTLFPDSAVVHFRLHVVLSELVEEGDVQLSALASEELQRASDLLDTDELLASTGNHWVRSTIRRRQAVPYFRQATALRQNLRRAPPTEPMLRDFLNVVRTAFGSVFDDFPFEREPAANEADAEPFLKMEIECRINNVVYGAALFLEVESDLERLHPRINRVYLLNLIRRLHPHGIHEVSSDNIAHTIGCAYRVLGEALPAQKAGERLMQLIYGRGTALTERPGALTVIEDALQWSREAARAPQPQVMIVAADSSG